MTAVPAAGLPKITSVVSRSRSPAPRAASLWSITAKTVIPFAARISVSRDTVAATGRGLTLVTTCVSVHAVVMAAPLRVRGPGCPPFQAHAIGPPAPGTCGAGLGDSDGPAFCLTVFQRRARRRRRCLAGLGWVDEHVRL